MAQPKSRAGKPRGAKATKTDQGTHVELAGLPPYLSAMSLSALPFDFEWDDVIRDTLLDDDDERNMRLAEQLSELRDEAVFALGLAAAEWVVARVAAAAPSALLRDAIQRIEALWALCYELRYARLTDPPVFGDDAPAKAEEPLWVCRTLLFYVYGSAVQGDDFQGEVMSQILLARQVMGAHKGFSTWLTASLKKAKQHYAPTKDELDDEDAQLIWRPVPRELFWPDFTWTSAEDAKARIEAFIAGLDPATNPYLRSPEDMLKANFKGTPYGR